jgi:hypothetical protein
VKTPEEMAEEYSQIIKSSQDVYLDDISWELVSKWEAESFLAGYHTAYNIAYKLGFEEALKTQKTLTYIQAEIKKNNENT